MLSRDAEKDQNILHVAKSDSFQNICLHIKKIKNVFTQGEKINFYVLTEKEQITHFFHPFTPPLFPNSLDYRGMENYNSTEEGKTVYNSTKAE